jgi:hypothetical protein
MSPKRRGAFDPARLDDDLDDLLPPPAPFPAIALAPQPRPARDQAPEAAPSPRIEPPAPRAARTAGRPPRLAANEAAGGTTASAVRIPKPLYDEIQLMLMPMIERPSYAQIIAWTCEDHRSDVLDELARATRRSDRAPRGRRLAADGVPVTPRFQPDELQLLEDVIGEAAEDGAKITRTAAVVAALRVAIKHGVGEQA